MPKLKLPGEHLPSVWIDPANFKLAETFQADATAIMADLQRTRMNQVEYFPASRLDEIGARLQRVCDENLKLQGKLLEIRKRKSHAMGPYSSPRKDRE